MDTLTFLPVSSYFDVIGNEEGKTAHLCTYFSTSLFEQLLENISGGHSRFAILGSGGVVTDKHYFGDDLAVRTIQIYTILWQQDGSYFAGIACKACKPASMFPYIYEIMTGVPIRCMTVMLISKNKDFKLINFDSSFPEWYQKNKLKN